MANPLLTALRADDKSAHLFESNGTFVAYKTGFPELDYDMGFMVNVFDDSNKLVKTYPAKGIVAGSVVCIIGKTHVGKTTLASQIAANIVRPFPAGCVFHYDLEGGSNDEIEAITVKYGVDTEISDAIPKKEGFVFESWNTKPDGTGKTIKPGDTYNGKDGLVLYAQYRMINPITGRSIFPIVILVIVAVTVGYLITTSKSQKNWLIESFLLMVY